MGSEIQTYGVGAIIAILSLQLCLKLVGFVRHKMNGHSVNVNPVAPMCQDHDRQIIRNQERIEVLHSDVAEIKSDVKDIHKVLIDSHTGTKIPPRK